MCECTETDCPPCLAMIAGTETVSDPNSTPLLADRFHSYTGFTTWSAGKPVLPMPSRAAFCRQLTHVVSSFPNRYRRIQPNV